ncbi:hypothetical protein Mpet_2303 [Methanolacinia petrolearia DSM 11571]|uniref:Uncharacterized protein n=1 Tax=Methanolacinia petrolearia (strain DSM 11571 / OCM 486 / SEBR 4847) TaxID=679926 RepID=E1RD67_METP4|nr:hypothetical protein [Methanolacinia petrolearia]ADN37050.1 hypothetical protein Mpet_2303 [Methanolacinia petrolearia DSM 11571]
MQESGLPVADWWIDKSRGFLSEVETGQDVHSWLTELAEKVRQWEKAEDITIKTIWVSDSGHIYSRYRPNTGRHKTDFTKAEYSRPFDMILADLKDICEKYGIFFDELSFPKNHENRISAQGRHRYMPVSARFYHSVDLVVVEK